ncbi:MAG: DUF4384 domain-containing protein, partial [Acidiferrobacterales bacterium]
MLQIKYKQPDFFLTGDCCQGSLFGILFFSLFIGLLLPVSALAAGPHKSPITRKLPITLEITTHLGDNQNFVSGDTISFFVSMDRDAYLLIIYQNARKELVQILPNIYNKNNFYKKGDFFQIPNEKRPFKFKISAPFGKEKIMAFASSRSFPNLQGITTKSGLKLLQGNLDAILTTLRKHGRRRGAYGEAVL